MTLNLGRIREKQAQRLITRTAERHLIYELVEDARAPLSRLAKKIHISKDQANYLFNKLQKENIIEHTGPIVNLTKLGYNTYHVFFVTNDENKERKEEFLNHLASHSHTKALVEYTDRWEVEWTLVAKDLQEFDRITTKLTTKYSDIIIEKSKLSIIKGYKSTTIAARHQREIKKKNIDYKPDFIDLKILAFLEKDGRMSSYNIAEKLKISPNTVRYRIKKMLQSGIIRHFTATVNLNALGYHLYTVGIILKALSETQERQLKEYLKQQRFVIRAVKVLGHWDLLVTILSDNIRNFHKTIKGIEDMFSPIITNYEALIAYEERVYNYLPKIVEKEN